MRQLHYLVEIEGFIRDMYGLSWPIWIYDREEIDKDLRAKCSLHIKVAYI